MPSTSVHSVWMTAIGAAAMLLAGCSSVDRSTPAPAALGGPPSTSLDPLAKRADALEKQMTIGPVAARSLGLHPTWTVSFAADAGVKKIWPTQGGVFVLDGRNELSLLDTDTGLRKWRAFIADPGHRILDLHIVPDMGLIVILRSDAIVTIDLATGFQRGPLNGAVSPFQRLQWLGRTGGELDGTEFIYGGLGGEVVWQSWQRGFSTRAHRVGRRISMAPVMTGNTIIAASMAGHVSALDAGTGALLWSKKLLDSLGASPVCSDDYVYVSGLDQHLRCLAIGNNGRTLWTALLKAPLHASATLIGDVVYQQVPGTGLTAWEATPANAPDGVHRWTAADVTGSVLSTYGNKLLTWQLQNGALATISPTTGSIDVKLDLPLGTRVQTTAIDRGRIFVITPNGRIESLIPAG